MEKTMKKTLNAALFLALFAAVSFAEDGNQGSGGRSCDPNVNPTCTIAAPIDTGEETGMVLIGEALIRGLLGVFELLP